MMSRILWLLSYVVIVPACISIGYVMDGTKESFWPAMGFMAIAAPAYVVLGYGAYSPLWISDDAQKKP